MLTAPGHLPCIYMVVILRDKQNLWFTVKCIERYRTALLPSLLSLYPQAEMWRISIHSMPRAAPTPCPLIIVDSTFKLGTKRNPSSLLLLLSSTYSQQQKKKYLLCLTWWYIFPFFRIQLTPAAQVFYLSCHKVSDWNGRSGCQRQW